MEIGGLVLAGALVAMAIGYLCGLASGWRLGVEEGARRLRAYREIRGPR